MWLRLSNSFLKTPGFPISCVPLHDSAAFCSPLSHFVPTAINNYVPPLTSHCKTKVDALCHYENAHYIQAMCAVALIGVVSGWSLAAY